MMQGPLSVVEQKYLLDVIESLYGTKQPFLPYMQQFNQKTVDVVEGLLIDQKQCNANMQSLLIGIVGGAVMTGRGWLRKALKELADKLREERVLLNGAACRHVVRLKGVTPIIASTF